jgi:hypothetical protein
MALFTALAIGSIALSAYGQVRAARAEKKAGEAQRAAAESGAELAEYNATIADQQAQSELEVGAAEESRFRQGVKLMIGSQRAGQAGQNIDVGFGSAVDVQADAAYLGELDALTIRTNAARAAWGHKVAAEDLRKRAEIARKEGVMLEEAGKARATAGYLGAAGTIVGGTASLLQARYGAT